MSFGASWRRVVVALTAALALALGAAVPAGAESVDPTPTPTPEPSVEPAPTLEQTPIAGEAALHANGVVGSVFDESVDELRYVLATEGGTTIDVVGAFDPDTRVNGWYDATFLIPAGVAAAAGIPAGATIEADTD